MRHTSVGGTRYWGHTVRDRAQELDGDGALIAAPRIDGYRLDRVIGRGAMSTVYGAVQLPHNRPVAIKVLAERFRDDPVFVRRFSREAASMATLEHPNVLPMLDSGEADGVPFIVMRLVDGPTLRELIGVVRPGTGDAVGLLDGVAAALDFAHTRGVLHRDVKPHNVLVEHGRHVWLTDFGLMRLIDDETSETVDGSVLGTFDYLAPEIARGERATAASDVYGFAVTAFQTLTGSLPFPVAHRAAAVLAHASERRPAASEIAPCLPADIDEVLRRGMAIDPHERPTSAGALMRDVHAAVGSAPPSKRGRLALTSDARAADDCASLSVDSAAGTVVPTGQRRHPSRLLRPRSALLSSALVAPLD